MKNAYNFREIESEVSSWWAKEKVYDLTSNVQRPTSKGKMYCLSMFPYPSGAGLHVGHVRIYTGTDVLARYFRMKGYDVLHPMGWDAFGLPAENAALKEKKNPMDMVPRNIETFKGQMKRMGLSYDWTRELATTDPEYYKWTQWLFIQFYNAGLLYKKDTPVYYCEFCKTGLAEEEVLPNGTHERCNKPITRKNLPQWIFNITKYADSLLETLDRLDWPKGILEMQRNWIGKDKGLNIKFEIRNPKSETNPKSKILNSNVQSLTSIVVWTKFWETVFGTTFLVLAPEHPFVASMLNKNTNQSTDQACLIRTAEYVKQALAKTDEQRMKEEKVKTGVFTGYYAINPVNGKQVPIWVADYVLSNVGTGAVMGVPAHDERDYQFAKKYDLPIVRVVAPEKNAHSILMGLKDGITSKEVEKTGARVVGKTAEGSLLVEVPHSAIQKYESFVAENLQPGFWNEYVGKEIVFTFKFKNSTTKRIVLALDTEKEIDQLATEFNNEKREFMNVWRWLSDVDFYKEHIIHETGGTLENSGTFDGESAWEEGKEKMAEWMIAQGQAEWKTTYHLRDWIFSRQRYWGEPIPMIYCESCAKKPSSVIPAKAGIQENTGSPGFHPASGTQPEDDKFSESMAGWYTVPESELPLKLPYMKSYEPSGTGESPLVNAKEWVKATCPNCGGEARRETDTMPNWAGSCWYFLHFAWGNDVIPESFVIPAKAGIQKNTGSPGFRSANGTQPEDDTTDLLENWKLKIENSGSLLPVDWYLGGAEHAVLHLLYARFWMHVLNDLDLLPFREPFLRLRNVGMVLAGDHKKMSKSVGNVLNPDDVVNEHGADTLRLYEMFMAPFNMEIAWSTTALLGANRFIKRFYQLVINPDKVANDLKNADKSLISKLQKVIQKIDSDIPNVKFNTSIAQLMGFINEWEAGGKLPKSSIKQCVQLLAPFAPFVADYLWRKELGEKESVHISSWPKVDTSAMEEELVTLPVQVNGKVRATITVPSDKSDETNVVQRALTDPKINKYIEGNKYKTIYVAGKILNFIV